MTSTVPIIIVFCSILNRLISAPAEPLTFDAGNYQVTAHPLPPPRDGASPIVDLVITGKRTGQTSSVRLENSTRAVDQVFAPCPGTLVVIGELDAGEHTASVIDPVRGKLIDTIYTWQLAVSRSKRYLAYQFRYPPHGLSEFRNDVLLLYDFQLSPEAIPHVRGDDAQKGFILYPERNRIAHRYALPWLNSGQSETFSSPIRWSEADTSLAVLDSLEGITKLVLVNLTDGPRDPKIAEWKIDKHLFLDPSHQIVANAHLIAPLVATALTFAADDTTVLINSQAMGPFRKATARLSLSDGKQAIEGPEIVARHVALPPQTKYIRVGESTEANNLLKPEPPSELTWHGPESEVRFEALIGTDGRIERLQPLAGPPALIPIADRLLRRRLYRETVLNGRKIAVLTTISLVFKTESTSLPEHSHN